MVILIRINLLQSKPQETQQDLGSESQLSLGPSLRGVWTLAYDY